MFDTCHFLVTKACKLWQLACTNPEATEEINAQWEEFNREFKLHEVKFYGRLFNEILTSQILEHFLKRKSIHNFKGLLMINTYYHGRRLSASTTPSRTNCCYHARIGRPRSFAASTCHEREES